MPEKPEQENLVLLSLLGNEADNETAEAPHVEECPDDLDNRWSRILAVIDR